MKQSVLINIVAKALSLTFIIIVSFGTFFIGSAPQALAAPSRSFIVNSAEDALPLSDATHCATAQGTCTLRQAISEANLLSGITSIHLSGGTYKLVYGSLIITSNLFLESSTQPSIIDGQNKSRVFDIQGKETTVTMLGITIQQGFVAASQGGGAGIRNQGHLILSQVHLLNNQVEGSDMGGAILNQGVATLSEVSLELNKAAYGAGFAQENGEVIIVNSTFKGNSATQEGGALYSGQNAKMTISHSVINENSALYGAGIASRQNSQLSIQDTTFQKNSTLSAGWGGGLFTTSNVTIVNSTFTKNSAFNGGAISNDGVLELTNSTISGNSSENSGGGIYSTRVLTLNQVTIAQNEAHATIGDTLSGGGGINASGVSSIRNTLLAGNQDTVLDRSDCVGELTSAGFNLIQTIAGCPSLTDVTSITSQNPQLTTLSSKGGATQTHWIPTTSPAATAGSCSKVDGQLIKTDQRGIARPSSGCSIGAYQVTNEPLLSVQMNFSQAIINKDGRANLILTLRNDRAFLAIFGINMEYKLPEGLEVAENMDKSMCGGKLKAVAGSRVISFTAWSLEVNDACTLSTPVIARQTGFYTENNESINWVEQSAQGSVDSLATLIVQSEDTALQPRTPVPAPDQRPTIYLPLIIR